ncbi:hypothetical protein ABYF34_02760 [Buchananella felis]|uniref:hypothetical protein n=1 Tax=Buchananella felis TaxID=3231492 RepID=UPI0035289B86
MELEEFFEFERRFLVPAGALPELRGGTLLLQVYLTARDGFSVRVRLEVADSVLTPAQLEGPASLAELVESCAPACTAAWLAVKGPGVGGVRFEREMELPASVGVELARQGSAFVLKTRYSLVEGEDLWEIDVFHGANHPLVIAECERASGVERVQPPAFCGREITEDAAFSNESLAFNPPLAG